MVPLLPKTVILDLLVIFAGKMASIENPFLPTLLLITLYSSQKLFIGILLFFWKDYRARRKPMKVDRSIVVKLPR